MSNGNISESAIRLRKHEHLENDMGYDECSHLSADQQDENNLDGNYDYCQSGELPPPPDGGYGWVICFASFMCNMIVDGIAYTFGIFLSEFVQYFDEGKGKVAWVGSLLSGVYLSAGPIVSALANKYGCRTVCIVGSIVGCIAFVLSTFSSSVNILMLSYGVIGGFGFGLIYLPAVVAVGYYFETKRSLATGIAVCGSGFGTFAFAPLATFLLQRYGWKNALLIFAGLILNCAIFGALMRPLTYPKKKHTKPLMQRMYEEKQLQLERGSIGGSHIMVQLPDTMANEQRKMRVLLNADPGVHSSVNLELLAQQQSTGILQPVSTLPTITEVRLINQQADIEEGGGGGGDSGGGGSSSTNNKRNNNTTTSAATTTTTTTTTFDIIRNSSQPAFNIDHQVLPKNGSVPSFSRFRKTSAHERFQPSLAAIRASSRGEMDAADLGDMHLATSKASLFQRQNSKMVRPMSRKDIFYSGSVTNLPQYQSQKSLTNYRNSVLSLTKCEKSAQNLRTTLDPPPVPINGGGAGGIGIGIGADKRRRVNYLCSSCFALPHSIKSVFSTMLDVSLLRDPVFMLIGISNVFGMAGLYVPFVYLVDAAKMAGIEENSASFLLSIIGITNTIGRVMCGYVADFPQVDSLLLNNVCLLISTVAVSLTPICTVYSAFVTMSIFFGIAISGYISLTSIILVDLLGLDKLTNAFGLLILFRGFAAIMGSPLAGAVYDATQSYDLPFYMAGALFALSTITSFIAPCLKHCTPPHERPIHIEALTPINEEQSEIMEDDDDQPITMVPKIVQTLPSPQQEVYTKSFNDKEMPTTSAAFNESRL